jgi:hypothetical protein
LLGYYGGLDFSLITAYRLYSILWYVVFSELRKYWELFFGKTCFSFLYKVFSQLKFPTFTKTGMRNYQSISFHVKMVISFFLWN